jgi:protein-L-isoaspartate(D-aspartate) O-methyltransferase
MSREGGADGQTELEEFVDRVISPTGVPKLVLAAFHMVDRAKYIPADERHLAYDDSAIGLENGSTISQPTIVALMLRFAKLGEGVTKTLEVGTASGYNAALMSHLSRHVDTVEVNPGLARQAEKNLRADGRKNVDVHVGDGALGWAANAPYERIIVTAALKHVTEPLLEQLSPEGIIVAPTGNHPYECRLTVIKKTAEGGFRSRKYTPCSFVPLVSPVPGAWPEGSI